MERPGYFAAQFDQLLRERSGHHGQTASRFFPTPLYGARDATLRRRSWTRRLRRIRHQPGERSPAQYVSRTRRMGRKRNSPVHRNRLQDRRRNTSRTRCKGKDDQATLRLSPKSQIQRHRRSQRSSKLRLRKAVAHLAFPLPPSLLLFVNKRRHSSGWLVVRDGGHFLSIGRDRDLVYGLDFAVALVSRFDGVVVQLLQRHGIVRIGTLHRVLFAIEFGLPAIACRCGYTQPTARTLPRGSEPGGVFIDVFDPPRTGGRIRAVWPL